jgi:hypothetical protein
MDLPLDVRQLTNTMPSNVTMEQSDQLTMTYLTK